MGAQRARRLGAVTSNGDGSEHVQPEPPALPDPPAMLGDDALKVWTRLAPIVPDDKLTQQTADAFAQLCIALATYEEAHGIIIEAGLLIAQGQDLVPNPGYPIRSHQGGVALNLLRLFGLTPDQPPSTKPGRGGYRPHLVE